MDTMAATPQSTEAAMLKFVEMMIDGVQGQPFWIDKVEVNPVKKEVRVWFGSEGFGRSRPIAYRFDEENPRCSVVRL